MISTKKQIAIALFALVLSFLAIALAQNAIDTAMTNASVKINESQVTNLSVDLNQKVNKSGDTMSGYLGIGRNNPAHPVDVLTSGNVDTRVKIQNDYIGNAARTGFLALGQSAGYYFGAEHLSSSTNVGIGAEALAPSSAAFYSGGSDINGINIIASAPNANISFFTGSFASSSYRGKITNVGLNLSNLNSSGTHAVCTYSNTVIVSSTNASSNYLTC